MKYRIEVSRSFNARRLRKEWRWRFVASNGRIMAHSGESYVRRIDCADAIETIAVEFNPAPIIWSPEFKP